MGIRIGIGKVPLSSGTTPARYRLVSDGLIIYKKWLKEGKYVIDYSDDGGDTWALDLVSLVPTEDTIIITIDSGPEGYRDLVRDGAYVIDQELTPTGFEGTEDIDWTEVFFTKPM